MTNNVNVTFDEAAWSPFDHLTVAIDRQADALEAILALLTARLPDLVIAPAPQAASAPAVDDDWHHRVPSYLRWVNHDSRCAELAREAADARSFLYTAGKTVAERTAAQETIRKCKRQLTVRRNKLKKISYRMRFIDDVLYRYDWTTNTREVWQAAFLPE
jgi:alpha-beta hydrolase superfamily lysophospholipase